MPSFLIVHSALQDGRLDAYRQPPTLDIGGLRAPLDWGDITLHVPAGDLPVTIFVTRSSGEVEGATITVRSPAGTGTRLTFVPPLQPGGRSVLRIDGQWPSDSSMHYYAARDARTLQLPVATASAPARSAPAVPPEVSLEPAPAQPTASPAQPVGPMPGSSGSVPPHSSEFGRQQGAVVDPVQSAPQQPSFGQRPLDTQRDLYGRAHPAGDAAAPPIPTPAEFHRLEREASEAQRRVYEAWRAQQPHATSSQHEGAPPPIGLDVRTGQAQPNWYPDPFRRAESRWFDGRRWTASVMRAGVRGSDQPG